MLQFDWPILNIQLKNHLNKLRNYEFGGKALAYCERKPRYGCWDGQNLVNERMCTEWGTQVQIWSYVEVYVKVIKRVGKLEWKHLWNEVGFVEVKERFEG